MKSINQLSVDISKLATGITKKLIEAQRKTADIMWQDVIDNAPSSRSDYISSIKISDTKVENDKITTKIYTDLLSDDGYAIGRMIENGTGIYALEPHIGHTKTFFESGYRYWYVPAKSVSEPIGEKIIINGTEFYIAYAQPPKPHFRPALEKNKKLYKENIGKAIVGDK